MITLLLISVLAAEPTRAVTLFSEGRTAMKAKQYDQACAAFRESQRLDPALGTLLNLADCLEKSEKPVEAWRAFDEGARWAGRNQEPDRVQFARDRMQALASKLGMLSLSGSEVSSVLIDGVSVDVPLSPVSIPVLPGAHRIEAPHDSRFSEWSISVTIRAEDVEPVLVPKRKSIERSSPPPPPPPLLAATVNRPRSSAGPVLMVTGGLLAVAGGVGLGFTFLTYGDLQKQKLDRPSTSIGVSRDELRLMQWVYPASWISAGVGVAAFVTGLLLHNTASSVTVAPTLNAGGAGVSLGGAW